MKRPWYMKEKPGVALMVALGGLFTVVNLNSAQPWAATSAPCRPWTALAASADGSKLLAAAIESGFFGDRPGPIYASTDGGATWVQTIAPSNNWTSIASSADGAKLVASAGPYWVWDDSVAESVSAGGAIYRSLDSGVTWTPTIAPTNNWTSVASSADGTKLIAAAAPRDLWVGTNVTYVGEGAVYRSVDSGATWMRTSAPSNFWCSVASSADGSKSVAAAGQRWDNPGLIYTSADSGATWTATSAPRNNWTSVASSADGVQLVAAAALSCPLLDGRIYISTNSGGTWTQMSAPSTDWTCVVSSADGGILFAAANGPGWFANSKGDCTATYDGGIYTSGNSGATWTQTGAPTAGWAALACSADGHRAVAADRCNGLLCITPYAGAWRSADAPNRDWHTVASSADGAKLIAGAYSWGEDIFLSTNSGSNWTRTGIRDAGYWRSMAFSADGAKLFAASDNRPLYASKDSGFTWRATSAPSDAWVAVACSADGNKLVAGVAPWGTGSGILCTSKDSGATWARANAPRNWWSSIACSADGTKFVALAGKGTGEWVGDGLIYTSTDSGATWARTAAPANGWASVASSADGNRLVAVAGNEWRGDGLIYISTDSGATWGPTTAPCENWTSASSSADGATLIATHGSSDDHMGAIYLSTTSGSTWTRAEAPAARDWASVACSADGSRIVAVSSDGPICMLWSPAPPPPLAPSPRLKVDRSGADLSLSWLAPSTRFVLQQSRDLSSANWLDASASPALDSTNLHYRVTLTPSVNSSFYRLKQQ